MKQRKQTILLAALFLGLAGSLRAGAVTLNWSDLTNAQQEQAYLQLESENAQLREQIAQLEGQLQQAGLTAGSGAADEDQAAGAGQTGIDQTAASGETGTEQATASQVPDAQEVTDGGFGLMDASAFLADLSASFGARQEIARTKTAEEVSAMDEEEMWAFRFRCAEAEQSLYETYQNAQFDDLNLVYLCSEYCLGLEKQYSARDVWERTQDSEEANRLYTAGYYNRAYALVELCEFYGLDLAQEYANLKNAVAQMDALSGEETRNAAVDAQTVRKVQELLNGIGFLCGEPDGIAGRQTASSIERFQLMYGYEPADGVIDEELIGQLQDVLAQKQG